MGTALAPRAGSIPRARPRLTARSAQGIARPPAGSGRGSAGCSQHGQRGSAARERGAPQPGSHHNALRAQQNRSVPGLTDGRTAPRRAGTASPRSAAPGKTPPAPPRPEEPRTAAGPAEEEEEEDALTILPASMAAPAGPRRSPIGGAGPRSPLPAAPQLPRRRRGAGAGRGRSALPRGPAEEWGEGGGSALSPALNNKGRPRGRRAAEPPPLPPGAGSVSELGEWGRRGMSVGCPSARALPRGYGTGSSRAGESAAAGRRLCFSVEKRFSSSTWEAQKKPKQLRSHSSNSLKANPKQGQGKASQHRNAAGPAQKVPSPGEKMLCGAGRGLLCSAHGSAAH